MRGGALPPILLCAALGFALSFAPRRAIALCLVVLILAAVTISAIGISPARIDAIFYLCWASVVVSSVCVHLPNRVNVPLALFLALNTGIWAGAVTSVAGTRLDLAVALPFALACLPGAWLVVTGRAIAIKIMASWLIAVAVLAAFIPITTPTPGYVADHME